MKSLFLIFLMLVCGGAAWGQEQESTLMSKLLNWNMAQVNPMQDKAYEGGGGGYDVSKTASVKEFDIVQKFSSKSFETKDFNAKNFWGGDFQFSTKAATVKTNSDADKVYETKAATVKDARESGKEYSETKGYATREAVEKGKTSQNHLDELYLGKPRMSMDEVRDLLNKDHRAAPTEIQQ